MPDTSPRATAPSADASSADTSSVHWERQARFAAQMLVTLDGLWFANVLEALGPETTFKIDVRVFQAQFKLATRLWCKLEGRDGKSAEDKAAIFRALADLYGHRFEVIQEEDRVTLRLHQCAFLENLRRAGRDKDHDCRPLCRQLAPVWFQEMEPRTDGKGHVDLGLPVGGACCDWTVEQPIEV